MRTSHHGFTLVETMIAVAVCAVLLTTAAPSFQRAIESRRLQGTAAQLAADLQFARAEAQQRQTSVRITTQRDTWGSCWVIHTGAAADCTCSATPPAACVNSAQHIKTVVLPAQEGLALTGTSRSMLFDPVHGTTTPTGTWRLTAASGRAIHHIVNVVGRVRSCSPDHDGGNTRGITAC